MNDAPDLSSALTRIAAGAARAQAVLQVAGADLPLAAVHTAARRRRVRFETGIGMVAATVVGTLALGGAALNGVGHRDGTPADTESWDVDYSACGTTVDDPAIGSTPDPDADSPALLVAPVGFPADSNALVTIATSARGGGQTSLERVATQHGAVAVVLGRGLAQTVVGVLGVPTDSSTDRLVPADADSVTLTTTAPLFSCLVQDGATRLEAGMYTLLVSRMVEVQTDGVTEQLPVTTSWDVTIPPVPTSAGPDTLPTTSLASGPSCGEQLDVAPGDTGPLTVSMNQPPAVTEGTGLMDVSAFFTMTNGTDHTIDVAAGSIRLVLTLGGTVVGFSDRGTPAFPFEPGTARAGDDGVSYGLDCLAGLMPGGAQSGGYQLWVVVGVAGDPATNLVAGPWAIQAAAPDPNAPTVRLETSEG